MILLILLVAGLLMGHTTDDPNSPTILFKQLSTTTPVAGGTVDCSISAMPVSGSIAQVGCSFYRPGYDPIGCTSATSPCTLEIPPQAHGEWTEINFFALDDSNRLKSTNTGLSFTVTNPNELFCAGATSTNIPVGVPNGIYDGESADRLSTAKVGGCTGTILGPNAAATADHCLPDNPIGLRTVVIGEPETPSLKFPVTGYARHPRRQAYRDEGQPWWCLPGDAAPYRYKQVPCGSEAGSAASGDATAYKTAADALCVPSGDCSGNNDPRKWYDLTIVYVDGEELDPLLDMPAPYAQLYDQSMYSDCEALVYHGTSEVPHDPATRYYRTGFQTVTNINNVDRPPATDPERFDGVPVTGSTFGSICGGDSGGPIYAYVNGQFFVAGHNNTGSSCNTGAESNFLRYDKQAGSWIRRNTTPP